MGAPLEFYNGEITLRFSERDHIYYLLAADGTLAAVEGVTQTCGIIDKSMYLIPWAVKMAAEKLLRTMPKPAADSDEISIKWTEFETLVTEAKKAHKEKLVDAGDVGSAAHSWIEDSIRWAIAHKKGVVENLTAQAPEDERAKNCGHAALDWMKLHNVRWLKTEHKIYSRKHGYAGTMDGLAFVDSCDGECCYLKKFRDQLSIIDWKSSNYLRIDYLLQTAAYQQAEMEEFETDIRARWILRLGKEDGKFEPWYETDFDRDFEAFRLCLTLRRQHGIIEKAMADTKKTRTAMKKAGF